MTQKIGKKMLESLLIFQRSEITEHHIYKRLAETIKSKPNKKILKKISDDELRHYECWKKYSKTEVKPNWTKVRFYYWISRIFGFTFGIKLMERGEDKAQENYARFVKSIPESKSIMQDENKHEAQLISMLDEERLNYVGSIVLGLNDALVELTGSLAGLTLALGKTRLIALSGMIVGFAAALSMAASEYLSTKTEKAGGHPLRSSVYTGITYLATVTVLILPYLILSNPFICLAVTLTAAILIIAGFNYYISVARDESFVKLFLEMALISLGVALISFIIGYGIRQFLGVDV